MTVLNGQLGNQTTFNNAFVSRLAGQTDTVALLDLLEVSTTNLINVQRVINEALTSLGVANQAATDPLANEYSSNEVVTNGDDRKVAIGKLDAEFEARFNTTTGHDHDGVNSKQISATNLLDINLLFTEFGEYEFDAASGTSIDVTSLFSGQTAGGDSVTAGVITSSPNNYCPILEKTTGGEVEDAEGDRVFARLTESAGTWTLSFFTNEAGVETAHALSSQDIRFLYREVFTAANRPTIGANVGIYDTLSAVGDIPDAGVTQRGVVSTGSQSFGGIKDFLLRPTVAGVDVVDLDATQTLTNKTLTSPDINSGTINTVDLDGEIASNTSRVTIPKESSVNLAALSNKEASIAYDTTLQTVVYNDGVQWNELSGGGGGAGDADTIHLITPESFDDITAVDLTGNNADFDGGGTITVGSLTLATGATDLVKGAASVKYAPGADGSNDYFGFTRAIPLGLRGRLLSFSFEFKNDSTTLDNDFRFCVKQKDGSSANAIDYINMESFNSPSSNSSKFSTSSFIEGDCTEIEFGWQNTTATTTVELTVDNILVSSDPFVYKDLTDVQVLNYTAPQNQLQDPTAEIRFPTSLTSSTFEGKRILEIVDNAGSTRTEFRATRRCRVQGVFVAFPTTPNRNLIFYKNSSIRVGSGTENYSANRTVGSSGFFTLEAGEYFTLSVGVNNAVSGDSLNTSADPLTLHLLAEAEVEHVITPAQTSASDPIDASGVVTLPSAAWGTVSGYSYWYYQLGPVLNAIVKWTNGTVSSARAEIPLPPGFTVNSTYYGNSVDQIGMFRCANGGSTAAEENANYRRMSVTVDPSASTSSVFCSGNAFGSGSTIFFPDAPNGIVSPNTTCSAEFSVVVNEFSARSNFLAAVPVPLVAIISDQKPNGTQGGSSSANTVAIRDLNTVEGDESFVSLSSNQFTLPQGKYQIRAKAPGHRVVACKCFIYDVTNAAYVLEGTSGYVDTVRDRNYFAYVEGVLEITSTTTYQLRYYTSAAKASDGFGIPANSTGNPQTSERYSEVVITKYK